MVIKKRKTLCFSDEKWRKLNGLARALELSRSHILAMLIEDAHRRVFEKKERGRR